MYGQHAAMPSLLHVNTTLRNEIIGLYYGTSNFEFIIHHRCVRHLIAWIKSQSAQTRKALIRNKNINIRVLIDKAHPDYDKMLPRLGRRGLIDMTCDWHFSVESFAFERMEIKYMMDVARSRRKWEATKAQMVLLEREGEIPARHPTTEARHACKVVLGRVCSEVLAAVGGCRSEMASVG